MGLFSERLAAKKAAANENVSKSLDKVEDTAVQVSNNKPEVLERERVSSIPPVSSPDTQTIQSNKPLSFAERARLAKEQGTISNVPAVEIPQSVQEPEQVNSLEPLGKVIQAYNFTQSQAKDKELDDLSGKVAPDIVKEIQQKIEILQYLEDGIALKHEMDGLSKLITANGEACRFLLDEDLGMFVRQLRRMTGNRVARDMATVPKKGRGAGKAEVTPQLTPSAMEDAFNDL